MMCLSKKISYQYFVVFCPAWDSFSSESILCHCIALRKKQKGKRSKWYLKTSEVVFDTDGHKLLMSSFFSRKKFISKNFIKIQSGLYM